MAAVTLGDRIVADPEILGGKPVIAGTRISVELVVGLLGRGMTLDDITAEYHVPREDVLAAVRFAAKAVGRDA
jgi:uncharacterized protein (DUF433 family)